jgi:triacylglycerol lipase
MSGRPMATHVYLSPGMFGFGELASFSYFGHVRTAIIERFAARGRACEVHVVDVHPTASIRRRAIRLTRTVKDTAGDGTEPIHVIGHSTGGLDARLVASPSVHLPGVSRDDLAWLSRLRSVTTMNTPHYGTPLAAFFATVSGQRVLYAITALTVIGLKIGAPPLAAASALLAAFGRVSGAVELELVERTTESVIRVLDDAASRDLRRFLRLIRDDQGAIVQLMPEAMDLFQAAVEDRPGLRYQSIASFAPGHAGADWVKSLLLPWGVVSAGLFTMLQSITARQDERYPCHAGDSEVRRKVLAMLGELPELTANDGVVPLYSQVWGDLVWIGRADHLDVVGHFPGEVTKRKSDEAHHDWLRSGARFDRVRFDTVIDRIFAGMLLGEETWRPS